MSKLSVWWKKKAPFARAFFILALVFLLAGLGTLGSVQSTGSAYELKKGASVVFYLTPAKDKKGTATQKTLKQIYINVGTAYTDIGKSVEIRMRRTSSSSPTNPSWYTSYLGTKKIDNVFSDDEKSVNGATFNWIAPYDISQSGSNSFTTYSRYELTAQTCNLLINEIVFVADDGNVVKAKIDKDFSSNVDVGKASAMLDRQQIPSLSQSSFFRYGEEETYSLMTISEMRMGNVYSSKNVYHADAVYNALGEDILALGTLIFGVSPFGLRVFPFLASFGVLVLGYLLVKMAAKSDKAGFAFGLLYALCGLSFGFGHLGTPFMLGVFFLVASLYACARFYFKGMNSPTLRGAVPLALSGLSAAAAVCVNSAFFLPVLGVVALFVAGMVRQNTAKNYQFYKAISETHPYRKFSVEDESVPKELRDAKLASLQNVVNVDRDFRYKNMLAPAVFFSVLVLGTLLLALIAVIPAYFTFVKVYDNPAHPALNLFVLMGKGFAGGFVGANALSESASAWSLFYRTFAGQGSVYAVTGAVVNVAALAVAVIAVVYAVVRIVRLAVKKEKDKTVRAELRAFVIPFVMCVLCLVTAIFAKGGAAFVFGAYVFAFMLASSSLKPLSANPKAEKAVCITAVVLLSLCFIALVPFLFSVPLPAEWLSKLVG